MYCCCPAIIFIQGNCCYDCVSLHQVDTQTLRSLSILVIAVVPYLPDCCFCRLRCMGVRDRVFCLAFVCSHSLGVARRYADFVYRVVDGCLVCILCKFCPGVAPVVCCIQLYRIPTVLSVCIKLYSDACCTDSILVVIVGPDFSYTHTGLFRCIFIGQGCNFSIYTGVCQAVAFRHASFAPAVYDIRSVCFLREVLYCCCPAIIFIQGNCCYDCVSLHQVDTQTLRSLSILVIAVVPYLPDCCFCRLRCMGVRDRVFCLAFVCSHSLGVARRYADFVYRVVDGCLVCILRKFCPGVCPVVCLVQHYRISAGLSVCFQLYADAFRSDSILVVTVCPYFSYTHTGLFR